MKRQILNLSIFALTISSMVGCGGNSNVNNENLSKGQISQVLIKQLGAQDTNTTSNNQVPNAIANGGIGFIEVNASDNVQFTSIGSNDSDGNITAQVWIDMDFNILSTNGDFNRTFYTEGVYEKTLYVVDDKNATDFDRVCVLVGVSQNDIPLIAKAGFDQNVSIDQNVSLSGRAVCQDNNLTYEWSENGEVLDTNATFVKSDFSVGTHALEFKVFDQNNNYAYDDIIITVN
jgi:hypothetical protein